MAEKVDSAKPVSVSGLEVHWRAVEAVKNRLLRTTAALEAVGVPYAVVGGHAVAAWVTWKGEGGERNTPDVDILIRRPDYPAAKAALEAAGFVHTPAAFMEVFLDGPQAKPKNGVKILFTNEPVKADAAVPSPDLGETVRTPEGFAVIALEPLVLMKLTAYRLKDRVHLRDLLDVELIDATWPAKFPPALAERLQHILDTPDG